MKALAKIINGDVVLFNKTALQAQLNELEGRAVEVTINLPKRIRSDNQNRYYWDQVVEAFSDHTGYQKSEAHEILMLEILGEEICLSGNVYKVVTKRTSQMNTVEMENYLSKARQWLSLEFGIYVPVPNETINLNG